MKGGFAKSSVYDRNFHSQAFLNHCHCLIQIGYSRMRYMDSRNSEEEVITGRIVREIKELLKSDRSPEWTKHYYIQEEAPLNADNREGKKRYRLDILITLVDGNRPEHHFEAKRLNNNKSLSKYTGPDGMGCFIGGKYSSNEKQASMLGYVQSESIPDWREKLQNYLQMNQKALVQMEPWNDVILHSKECDISSLACTITIHNRKKKLSQIRIYHQFLDFT